MAPIGAREDKLTLVARFELAQRGRATLRQSLFKIQNIWYTLSQSPETPERQSMRAHEKWNGREPPETLGYAGETDQNFLFESAVTH